MFPPPPFRGSSWLPKVLRFHIIRVSTKIRALPKGWLPWGLPFKPSNQGGSSPHLEMHPYPALPSQNRQMRLRIVELHHFGGVCCQAGIHPGGASTRHASSMDTCWACDYEDQETFSPQHVSLLMRVCLDARGHLTSFDRFCDSEISISNHN